MRGRMNDVKSYVPPFALGEPMEGGAVGTVVESRSPNLAAGDTSSTCSAGARQRSVPARGLQQAAATLGVEAQQWLGNLGLTGAHRLFRPARVAEAKEGDVVFVSAAAGAVGSAVVQIAKAKGMTVIGSAGGAEKCE